MYGAEKRIMEHDSDATAKLRARLTRTKRVSSYKYLSMITSKELYSLLYYQTWRKYTNELFVNYLKKARLPGRFLPPITKAPTPHGMGAVNRKEL